MIIPLGFVLFTVIAKGASIISWQFLTGAIPPNVAPANVGGMGPAIVGTLEITALATVLAVPLGVLGAIYLNEYGGNKLLATVIGFMSRRDDGRALDRDGAVHLLHLGAALRLLGPGRRVRPRLPDAADRDPLHRTRC